MPLYEKRCLQGHTVTIYAHTPIERYCRTVLCTCGQTMTTVLSFGVGLTYFSEKHSQTIYNMGHEPVTIASPGQHRDEMRKRGLAQPGVGYGMPGVWT